MLVLRCSIESPFVLEDDTIDCIMRNRGIVHAKK